MKKTLILVLITMITLSLTACNSKTKVQEDGKNIEINNSVKGDEAIWDKYSECIKLTSNDLIPTYFEVLSYDEVTTKEIFIERINYTREICTDLLDKISVFEKDIDNSSFKDAVILLKNMAINIDNSSDEIVASLEEKNQSKLNSSLEKYINAVLPSLTKELNNSMYLAKNEVFGLKEEVPEIEEYDVSGIIKEAKNHYSSLAIDGTIKLAEGNVDSTSNSNRKFTIKHGEFLSSNITEDILVIKTKIEPNLNNKLTISQNEFNVEDIIKNQGGDQFNEIQYWAVADMEDGSESKVISFTLDKNLIDSVKSGNTPANQIIDKSSDVWVLPSLKN
ncbi:hypothetical protein [Romboutsia lituseburensis]|uniref:Lipoprotein n=1 Tax=Romboutsia lituseburensis DSM 797 TaxID=1121325 RepID=A0A1G9TX81_9FIRM|nr:hypothetical protein [Romboutsia lituseburensis]CEH34697.1 Prokaryotic membrane lipoprotein lipid attachment site profile [Romboutsia lituseburensis]SDM52346.1 hypothetical protein SAMN04515677_1146 [Romboutsia lituseburensis DSM 797]